MNKLPSRWKEVIFEDVVDVNPRKHVELDGNHNVTFVPMAAVSEISGTIVNGISRPLHEVNRGFTQFVERDVIFAKITPSMENGKAAVATGLENGIGFGSTEFHVLRSKGAVLPEYIWSFIRQKKFRENAQKVMSGAVGQQRVPAAYLKSHPLPLPPLNEQLRIVEKISELFARTSNARAELVNIPSLVDRYKKTILKRIFKDIKGQETTIGALAEFVTSGSRGWAKYYSDTGSIFLRIGNTKRDSINLDLTDIQSVTPPDGSEGSRTKVKANDVLITITADLGRIALIPPNIGEAYVNQHMALVRLNSPKLARYISWFLVSPHGQKLLHENNRGTTRAGLGLNDVRNLSFILPEVNRQEEIVTQIEKSFKWLEQVNADHASANILLDKLDATILSKAFQGDLTVQMSTDETADDLLSRVKSERNPTPKRKIERRTKATEMIKDPKERLMVDSENWPAKGLSFEEISKRNTIPYDVIRDIIFNLLAEKKPRLRQVFDKNTKSMLLQRVQE